MAFVATIFCAGGLIGVAYLCLPRAQDALERANLMPRGVAIPFNRSAWMTQRVLGDVYKSSLDVVVADEQVIERLGEPIETDLAAPELYRRAARGTKLAREETIEYELIGPKARATVSVTAATSPMQIDEIKVTLEDGKVLELKSAVPEYADVQ
ncbi:MAG: cytochrome c oxidase assembly factor 1 family protein [Planctomycetaceae bacterium]|nr:cytochrome c oxidase assembly factor 1 family protein [Planctomycetaceae bacterium]